jgi:hypothetical protein
MAHEWPKLVVVFYIIKLHSEEKKGEFVGPKVLFIRRTGLKMKQEETIEMGKEIEVRNANME